MPTQHVEKSEDLMAGGADRILAGLGVLPSAASVGVADHAWVIYVFDRACAARIRRVVKGWSHRFEGWPVSVEVCGPVIAGPAR